ncbi:MAG: type II toxin-antitoxin system HicB family antitoxin [Proteobacteria bacterium]|nr:type II toxin-antitoxin system HicB family antitoxin [Pseudomonadota bacterium]
MNARHYTYRVLWSDEDGEYVGLCAELPGLSWLDASQEGALRGIVKVVTSAVADLRHQGEPVPEPLAARHYSGKFQVRIPPERHRLLALQAAEAGISLNRLVSDRLTV